MALIWFGCSEENGDDPELNLGYDYFPVEVGTYVEYRADSIWHDQPDPNIEGIHDTTSYFIREVIESELEDAAGEPAVRVERYKRNSTDEAWMLTDVWMAKRTAENAERVEENLRYIKLAFPIRSTASWDVNALNFRDTWQASYDSIGVPRELEDLLFPTTVRVLQRDFRNLIDDEFAYEIYAENVGLIKRYERDLTTQINYVNDPVASNIRLGYEFNWEIIDYGLE
jgi:hypothetical protein